MTTGGFHHARPTAARPGGIRMAHRAASATGWSPPHDEGRAHGVVPGPDARGPGRRAVTRAEVT